MRHIFAIFVSDGVTSFLSIDRFEAHYCIKQGWQREYNEKDIIFYVD